MDREGEWRLAPAYDLVFSEGPGGQHTMAVAGEGERPSDRDMLRVADDCDVSPPRAREIIDEVRAAVAEWTRFARVTGVSRETAHGIGDAIAGVFRS